MRTSRWASHLRPLEAAKERTVILRLLMGYWVTTETPIAFIDITANYLAFDTLRHLTIVSIDFVSFEGMKTYLVELIIFH